MKNLLSIVFLFIITYSSWSQGNNECYIIKSNLSGKTNLYSQTLYDTVCALIETVDEAVVLTSDTRSTSNFKIISYDLYPTSKFMGQEVDFDTHTKWAISDIESENFTEYIAVIKLITDQRIQYNVRLKLPTSGVFSTLNPVEIDAIQNKVEGLMNAGYVLFNNNWMAEIAGYSYLFSVVEDLLNNTFSINEFDESGFVQLDYPSFELTATGEITSMNNIYDYCGLKAEGNYMKESILGSDPSSIPTIGRPTYILTSNLCLNYHSTLVNAETTFKNSTSPVTIWLHYQEDNGVVKTYMKTKSNVSTQLRQSVLQNIIDEAYYETETNLDDAQNNVSDLDFDFEDDEDDENFPAFQNEEDSLQFRISGDCDFVWQDVINFLAMNELAYEKLKAFSFKKCYVDPEVSNDRVTDINFSSAVVQHRYYYKNSDRLPFFVQGAIYGIGDGLKDVVVSVWGICVYVGNLSPESPAYFSKLNELYCQGAITLDELNSDHKQLKIIQNDLYKTFQSIYENKDKIYTSLVEQLKTTVSESIAHPKWGGYYCGYMTFDILLSSATAGASKALSSSKLVTSISSKVKSTFKGTTKKIKDNLPKINIVSNAVGESVQAIKKAAYDKLLSKVANYKNTKSLIESLDPSGELVAAMERFFSVPGFDYLKKFETALNNQVFRTEIIDLIKQFPDDLTKVFQKLVYDPGFCWDLAKEGSEAWQRWIKSNIFHYLTKVADNFENGIAYSTFKGLHNLIDDQIVKQVTLEVSGIGPNGPITGKIRLDYIGKDINGKFYFGEAKFSTHAKNWASDWFNSSTKNQKKVLPLFQANNSITSIVVKATDPDKIQDLKNILDLNPNDLIDLNDLESFKLFGGSRTFDTIESFGSNFNDLEVSQIIDIKS